MANLSMSDTNSQFEAGFSDGDAAALAGCYTDTGKVLAPDTPVITGREAIQGYWQAVMDMGIKSVSLRTIELEEMGDTAVETGAISLTIGDSTKAEAKFVMIWKRGADGSWKYDTDCFNFDAPLV